MIKTVSDLLNKLKSEEANKLKEFSDIKHGGMIGDMYEGLTKSILDLSIFNGLNLNVVSGKIKNAKGQLSGQIDCMIVVGRGQQLPYSRNYIYLTDQVIAVIEVKKNLFSNDLKDSYEHLNTVINLNNNNDFPEYQGRIVRDCYEGICRRRSPANRQEFDALPRQLQMLYQNFIEEAKAPLRIVWGYNSFKSEFKLRESFVGYLQTMVTTPTNYIKGYSPIHFPNLIICDNLAVVKANGMPYNGPIIDGGWWVFYATSHKNPIYYFLELLWTRLDYRFKLPHKIFEDAREIESLHPFIKGKFVETGGMAGWAYDYTFIGEEELAIPLTHSEWQPTFLDAAQYRCMVHLSNKGEIVLAEDDVVRDIANKYSYEFENLVESLVRTGFAYLDNNNKLIMLFDNIVLMKFGDKFLVAKNNDQSFVSWLSKKTPNN